MIRKLRSGVTVVGAGAAGAFFALELSRLRPDVEIHLYNRGDRGPGAGIVMPREFANSVQTAYPQAFDLPVSAMATWDRTLTVVFDEHIWSGAYGMFGLSRRIFNKHLRTLAAAAPNVRLIRQAVTSVPDETALVVVADGANSRLRQAHQDVFGTSVTTGRTMFLWMSTPVALDPSFILKSVHPGLLIVHSYPHSDGESTFIVEADPSTLAAHGLFDSPIPEVEKVLARIFSTELKGATLHAQTAGWQSFRTVVNKVWHDNRMVLLGDAAHTVHFSTGLGTRLAIDDAFCLARALADQDSVAGALDTYANTRQSVINAAQAEARESLRWFEKLSRRERVCGHQTVFALRSRRAMNSFDRLRDRDPLFVAKAVEMLAGQATDAEPLDLPITLAQVGLTNRLVAAERRGGNQATLCLPTASGDGHCPVIDPSVPVGATGPVPSCVLVRETTPTEMDRIVLELRSAGASVIGLFIPDARRRDQSNRGVTGFDFLAVPSQPGVGRIARTWLADDLRYDSGLPVLLLSEEPMSRDEINTLIAAGRIDMAACVRADDLHVHERATA